MKVVECKRWGSPCEVEKTHDNFTGISISVDATQHFQNGIYHNAFGPTYYYREGRQHIFDLDGEWLCQTNISRSYEDRLKELRESLDYEEIFYENT